MGLSVAKDAIASCRAGVESAMAEGATRRLHISAGFIHVPLLPGAEPETDCIAGMRAEDTARAILAGISVLSAGFVV